MKEINCPKCIVGLETRILAGVEVDLCPRCQGMYLDERELLELRQVRGSDLAANEGAPAEAPLDSAVLSCPRCDNAMDRHPFADSEILIDSCPVCGGVWLDAGEFTAIYRYAEELEAGQIDPELLEQLQAERRRLDENREAAATGGRSVLLRFIKKILYKAGV